MVPLLIATSDLILPSVVNGGASGVQRRVQTRRPIKRSQTPQGKIDYSNFSHRTLKHIQSCDVCHKFPSPNWKDVREGDTAFPDITEYPQHTACMSCHSQQFFRGLRPVICSVCHVSTSPQKSPRFPYPSLGEPFFVTEKARDFVSDFDINFPHDKHIEIVARLNRQNDKSPNAEFIFASFVQEKAPPAEASCGVCHETYQPQGNSADEYVTAPPKDLPDGTFWLKKGTFKTIPMTHEKCFTCHSQESELPPSPKDCNACHKLRSPVAPAQLHQDFDPKVAATMRITDNITVMSWRKREAGAFRHEWFSHAELGCAACHKVATLNTLEDKTKKVPIASCGGAEGCHITSTTDEGGILNYVIEQRAANPAFRCTKCHIIFGTQPVPQSHLDAVNALKPK
jgi:hypothetical protein